ncbi:MAG TPA: hypothetical protein VHB47_24650 [Thermoanaerobaculia bacterium]|jgi:hypothetical protein|nr:hypothetical protein [Thermoanaerobaculia bacterium]
MLLRIFFLGLIAIAKGQNDATVLVLNAPQHTAYVAFDPGVCTRGCGPVNLHGTTVTGVRLQGFKLKLSPVTDSTHSLSFASGRKPATDVPTTSEEAADIAWIASIPDILKKAGNSGDGKASRCVTNPAGCGHSLAAQMPLTSGSLQTCHLIQVPGAGSGNDTVNAFDFESTGPVVSGQALASVATLVTSITTASDLTLELSSFGGSQTPTKLTLHPTQCQDQPGLQCIDVFVGNVAPENPNDSLETAPHFQQFFDLLDSSSGGAVFTPRLNHQRSTPVVQPVCRNQFPGIPNGSSADFTARAVKPATVISGATGPVLAAVASATVGPPVAAAHPAAVQAVAADPSIPETPFSRPICPLAVVAE